MNTDLDIERWRREIVRFGALMFNRRLTDSAGGNISVRIGDRICMTPRYAGSQHQWQLASEDVLVVDMDGHILDGDGAISREAAMHFAIYRAYPLARAVVHAHALNIMPFAVAQRPIEPVLESMRKLGTIQLIPPAPSHTDRLARYVAESLLPRADELNEHPLAVLLPFHGIAIWAGDLYAAYDALERIDLNAYTLLMMRLLQR